RPGWHGLADRGRHCCHRDARWLRVLSRVPAVSHGRIWSCHGRDHDLATARIGFDAHAFGISEETEAGRYYDGTRGRARMSKPILTVTHLTRRFGGLLAVDDLSFSAQRGDITAIIGPNGAGKTTVFNCVTGFYRPTVGMIRLTHPDGRDYLLERLIDFRIAKQARVARTFQNIRLFPGMTGLENLLVAQHNPLMLASGYTFVGMLGLRAFTNPERPATDKAK